MLGDHSHFDENTETIGAYITHIRQVATLLGYGESQILDALKYTPHKIILGIISHRESKKVVETVKRILTKGKIDRQLAGQFSSTPFMSVKDSDKKRVTFDT